MKTLLLDSSNVNLTVGIAIDDKIVYKSHFACWQRQSELMIPEIEKATKAAGVELLDVNEVVCGMGPGSYTGVRIAMTIAKIMCLMNGAELKLISSLQMFGNREDSYIAVMNARSARSYVGVYAKGETVLKDCILTNEETLAYIAAHPEYSVIGDTAYLKTEGKEPDELGGMMSYKNHLAPVNDVLSVRPVYLKDQY